MRSKARQERRLAREQEPVGAQRDVRVEQAKLGASSNLEVIVTKKEKRKSQEPAEPDETEPGIQPRRTARPGKPLKR